jgi:hypothetical protein
MHVVELLSGVTKKTNDPVVGIHGFVDEASPPYPLGHRGGHGVGGTPTPGRCHGVQPSKDWALSTVDGILPPRCVRRAAEHPDGVVPHVAAHETTAAWRTTSLG